VTAPAEARTWVTEVGYPAAGREPLQVLHSRMREPEPLPEPEPEREMEIEP
jgi:hypothetical protein